MYLVYQKTQLQLQFFRFQSIVLHIFGEKRLSFCFRFLYVCDSGVFYHKRLFICQLLMQVVDMMGALSLAQHYREVVFRSCCIKIMLLTSVGRSNEAPMRLVTIFNCTIDCLSSVLEICNNG
eukprot:TRINITY_DN25940_c0_g1_i1.p1 TRINITY_DN25940_c0_g1~~TRINITY_DN25940_c0_g1_i1.p1  ORF type:complete len:122 (-),score=3.68 TRINITY_DN25940_c0_g1_i1:92-457(-)